MLLDALISQDQIPYEESLLKNSDNEALWLEYFDAHSANAEKAVFILDRAVSELPRSTLLWNAYLQLPWDNRPETLLNLLERALLVLPFTPAYWLKYLGLLAAQKAGVARRRKALDRALFYLDHSHHNSIWQMYLHLAEEIDGPAAAEIYTRYYELLLLQSGSPPLMLGEQCILNVANHGAFEQAIELFRDIQKRVPLSLRLHAEFVLDFLQILLKDILFHGDFFVEQTARNAASDCPAFSHQLMLAVATYYSARQKLDETRHFHALAFKMAGSPADVVDVFDTVTDWEELQLEHLYENGKFEQLRLGLSAFARLLGQHSVLINDVMIKAHPHNIDHWLDRATIFQEKGDQHEVINTYVTAIRRVNPLQASSRSGHTMAEIWTKYAEIYISQQDLATANIVFSHAVKSQFRNVSELADLYIAWTEMIFTVSDDEALKHIELVLYSTVDKGRHDSVESEKRRSVHDQIADCGQLWSFYIDVLKSMIEDGEDNLTVFKKLDDAYSQLFERQVISLRLLLEYAEFTATQQSVDKSYAIYEAGIQNFKSPQAQFHIWTVYLDRITKHVADCEVIRDTFDRCVSSEIPGFQAAEIFEKYFTFELQQGNLVRAVSIMREAICYLSNSFSYPRYTKDNRNKIADDKFALYKKASSTVHQSLQDPELFRSIMSDALQDAHLTLPYSIELGLDFVEFEDSKREPQRVRAIFKYLAGLGHPDSYVMKSVWTKWEEWEVRSGTESSYKDMLRSRRQFMDEFKELSEIKAEINPMGFVIGETKGASAQSELADSKNPDAIDLDMDI